MYDVLNKTVKTNYGKEILRRHHNELDAQSVLTELRAHYKGSQAAVNETQQLFKYIVTAKITDFSGSAQKFILHWFEQIRLYETLTEEKKHLQPEQKLAMLQDAVRPSPALAGAIDASHQQIMSVHPPDKEPTLDDYKALLLHTATQLDARGKPTPKVQRVAYNTEQFYSPDESHDEHEYDHAYDDTFDIDTPAYTIMNTDITNALPGNRRDSLRHDPRRTPSTRTRPSLRMDQWKDLRTEAHTTWDTLSDEDKKIILRYHHPSQEPNKRLIAQ
jgi:hypothetical protein